MRQKLLKFAWVYGLICTIIMGFLILPLAWMIPMNVHVYKAYKEDKKVGIVFAYFYALLCDPLVGPWIFLSIMDKKERHTYFFVSGVLGCIAAGSSLVPLAWMIPLTVKMYHSMNEDQPMGPYAKVFWLLLMSVPQGVMLLTEDPIE